MFEVVPDIQRVVIAKDQQSVHRQLENILTQDNLCKISDIEGLSRLFLRKEEV
jgi:hypothetical protein